MSKGVHPANVLKVVSGDGKSDKPKKVYYYGVGEKIPDSEDIENFEIAQKAREKWMLDKWGEVNYEKWYYYLFLLDTDLSVDDVIDRVNRWISPDDWIIG